MSSAAKPQEVIVHTDGACKGNPGPGGWGAVLSYAGAEKELFGGEAQTTNNRMELRAVIEALNALNRGCRVRVVTDSQYVHKGVELWMEGWKRKNWKTAAGKPVANRDLWEALDEALRQHEVRWEWVRGHQGVFAQNAIPTKPRAAEKSYPSSTMKIIKYAIRL